VVRSVGEVVGRLTGSSHTFPAEQALAGDGCQRPLVPRSHCQPRLKRGVGPLSTRVSGEDWFLPFCASCPSAAGARAEGDQTRGYLVRRENPRMERRKSSKLALRNETSQHESQVLPGTGQQL
jgi:hypothetical protein